MRTEEWQEKAAFIDMLRELTLRLNRYRAAYAAHTPLVSDEIYDIDNRSGILESFNRESISLLSFK